MSNMKIKYYIFCIRWLWENRDLLNIRLKKAMERAWLHEWTRSFDEDCAMTLNEAIDGFREQWNWIANETLRQKRKVEKDEYFVEKNIDVYKRPLEKCYLCDFSEGIREASKRIKLDCCCDKCPIDWGGKIGNCIHKDAIGDNDGLFAKWKIAADYKEAARLARQIASLPVEAEYRREYFRESQKIRRTR